MVQQVVDVALAIFGGNAVQLGVNVQVLFDRQIDVAGQRLRNHAHAMPRGIGILGDIEAVDQRRDRR